jgi:hypothetical protein
MKLGVDRHRSVGPSVDKAFDLQASALFTAPLELRETVSAVSRVLNEVPAADNAPGAVDRMLQANALLRNLPWPAPFHETSHFGGISSRILSCRASVSRDGWAGCVGFISTDVRWTVAALI